MSIMGSQKESVKSRNATEFIHVTAEVGGSSLIGQAHYYNDESILNL